MFAFIPIGICMKTLDFDLSKMLGETIKDKVESLYVALVENVAPGDLYVGEYVWNMFECSRSGQITNNLRFGIYVFYKDDQLYNTTITNYKDLRIDIWFGFTDKYLYDKLRI